MQTQASLSSVSGNVLPPHHFRITVESAEYESYNVLKTLGRYGSFYVAGYPDKGDRKIGRWVPHFHCGAPHRLGQMTVLVKAFETGPEPKYITSITNVTVPIRAAVPFPFTEFSQVVGSRLIQTPDPNPPPHRMYYEDVYMWGKRNGYRLMYPFEREAFAIAHPDEQRTQRLVDLGSFAQPFDRAGDERYSAVLTAYNGERTFELEAHFGAWNPFTDRFLFIKEELNA